MKYIPHPPVIKNPVAFTLLVAAFFIPFVSVLMAYPAKALTIDSAARDCNDGNAVLNCGAQTPAEVKTKYNDSPAARTVYHYFDISSVDVDNLHSMAVEGRVTQGGRVLVGDKEVANNAVTAGMAQMGNDQKVTKNGTTFYVRQPSVSFQSSSLPAFVMMKNGQFDFAIIASCGNPVKATPVSQPTPAPAQAVVRPPAPTPTPPVVKTQTVVVAQPVAVPTPVPTPVPVPQPQPQAQPRQIPNTGVGDAIGSGSFIALSAGLAHFMYKKKALGF
jgi:hypothetical protein